jgi:rod shape-determining protein MreD
MMRRPVLSILVPALVILHFFLHLGLGIGRGAPDLLTVALLVAAREVGIGGSGGIGLFFGLLEDSFSVLAFGANALAMTVVGILGARTRDLFVGESLSFFFWYLALGIWLRGFFYWVVVGEGLREPFVNAVLVDGTVGAIYGALVGIIFLIPFGGRGRVAR